MNLPLIFIIIPGVIAISLLVVVLRAGISDIRERKHMWNFLPYAYRYKKKEKSDGT